MAQISEGIKIGYATAVDPRTVAPTYVYISDVTGIPALGSAPSTHDVTTLANSAKVYIKGLVDAGGNLDFPCIFTSTVIDEVATAITAQDSATQEWCVEFPAPLSKRFYFNADASPIYNESVDVDAPVTGTLSLVPSSEIEVEDIA